MSLIVPYNLENLKTHTLNTALKYRQIAFRAITGPHLFYNITEEGGNTFSIYDVVADTKVTAVVSPGNYTIEELLAELTTRMNAAQPYWTTSFTLTGDDDHVTFSLGRPIFTDIYVVVESADSPKDARLAERLGFDFYQDVIDWDTGEQEGNLPFLISSPELELRVMSNNFPISQWYDPETSKVASDNIWRIRIPNTSSYMGLLHFEAPATELYSIRFNIPTKFSSIRVELVDPYNGRNLIDNQGRDFSIQFATIESDYHH